jgi:hypothetical protein
MSVRNTNRGCHEDPNVPATFARGDTSLLSHNGALRLNVAPIPPIAADDEIP